MTVILVKSEPRVLRVRWVRLVCPALMAEMEAEDPLRPWVQSVILDHKEHVVILEITATLVWSVARVQTVHLAGKVPKVRLARMALQERMLLLEPREMPVLLEIRDSPELEALGEQRVTGVRMAQTAEWATQADPGGLEAWALGVRAVLWACQALRDQLVTLAMLEHRDQWVRLEPRVLEAFQEPMGGQARPVPWAL